MIAVIFARGRRRILRRPCSSGTVAAVFAALCASACQSLVAAGPSVREPASLKFIPDDAAYYGTALRLREQFETIGRSKAFARLRELPCVQEMVSRIIDGPSDADRAASRAVKHRAPGPADQVPLEGQVPKVDNDTEVPAPPDEGDLMEGAMLMDEATDFDVEVVLTPLRAFWKDPANASLLAFLADAVSNEVFIYADANVVEFLQQLGEIAGALAAIEEHPGEDDPEAERAQIARVAAISVPAFVIGFKLAKPDQALPHLAGLEQALREFLKTEPDFPASLIRQKIGLHSFLSLKLDGSRVPWEDMLSDDDDEPNDPDEAPNKPDDDVDDKPSDSKDDDAQADKDAHKAAHQKIIAKLKSRSLTVSLGLYEDYLLFSVGESNAHLTKFRGGKNRLADRPELAPIHNAPEKQLTSIGYVSQEMSRSIGEQSENFWHFAHFLGSIGSEFGLDGSAQIELLFEIKRRLAALTELRPEPSATTRWTCWTPHGYEGYSYRWCGAAIPLDGAKRLSILDHVGGNPLIAVANRTQDVNERYQDYARWAVLLEVIFDQWAGLRPQPIWQEELVRLKTELTPLVDRLAAATREKLLPALADGQSAFVLDARIARHTWHISWPESAKPLPRPAPALVYSVSDADLLKQACREYAALLQDAANLLHLQFPDFFPANQIRAPVTRETSDTTLYLYGQASSAGVPHDVAPNAALNSDVAVLSLAPEQTRRLLAGKTFAPGTFLRQRDRPLAAAWYVDFAGLIDVVAPWAEYLIDKTVDESAEPKRMSDAAQVMAVLEILKCWRGSAGMTYFDGPARVEFHETVFEDLK